MMERNDLIRQWQRNDGRKIEGSHFLGRSRLEKNLMKHAPLCWSTKVGQAAEFYPSLKHFKTNFEI